MRRMYLHPGEHRKILLANCLCIGFVPGDSVPLLKGPSKKNRPKEGRRSLCNFTPAISDYTPAVSDYTPAISDYTPITLTLFNFSNLITKNYTYTYTFQFF